MPARRSGAADSGRADERARPGRHPRDAPAHPRLRGGGPDGVPSSHLLDEVEKTCDEVAIVDRGKIVAQGSVAEIAGGAEPQLTIEVDDEAAARRVLGERTDVQGVTEDDGGALRVRLTAATAAADVNRALVVAGIAVSRLEPARVTLEERFLEITSRLEQDE